MSTITVNMPKPAGHALVVGTEASRTHPKSLLGSLGYEVDERDDPYSAMLDLCRRPLVYRALVLSLHGLYREEMQMISTVRRRFPHVAIWLANTDGRQAAMAEGMRMGAEAIISDEGIHSFNDLSAPQLLPPTQFRPAPVHEEPPQRDVEPEPEPASTPVSGARVSSSADPVLTAEELKALLGDDL